MMTTIEPCISRRYRRHGMSPRLAAFEAVVRLGSATRVAEALCIAQPTLSGHLRKLSEALGVSLFEPRGRGLVLTDAAANDAGLRATVAGRTTPASAPTACT